MKFTLSVMPPNRAALLFCCCALPSHAMDTLLTDEPPLLMDAAIKIPLSVKDTPASMTVISAEQIKQLGITDIRGLLRLIPGMGIDQHNGWDLRTNYHGLRAASPRRIQVLIDNQAYNLHGLARIDWHTLPIALDDIERVEVVRGSNSSTYGANAMTAVVKFIRKNSADVHPFSLSSSIGSNGKRRHHGRLAHSFSDTLHASVSVESDEDDGFDRVVFQPGNLTIPNGGNDDQQTQRLNVDLQAELANGSSWTNHMFYVKGEYDNDFVTTSQASFPNFEDDHYGFTSSFKRPLDKHNNLLVHGAYVVVDSQQEWQECLPAALFLPELRAVFNSNPDYAAILAGGGIPSGGTPTDDALAFAFLSRAFSMGPAAVSPSCGQANQNFKDSKYDLRVELLSEFDSVTIANTLGYRYGSLDSETFLRGRVDSERLTASSNVQWRLHQDVSLYGGVFIEKDQINPDIDISPRLGAIWDVNPTSALRIVYSQATRSPDTFEQKTNWSFTVRDLTPPVDGLSTADFYYISRPYQELDSEKIKSVELGVHHADRGISVDIKWFYEDFDQLISQTNNFFDFRLDNSNGGYQQGVEFEGRVDINRFVSVHSGYSYLDSTMSTDAEMGLYARHSGFMNVTYQTGAWTSAVAFYGAQRKLGNDAQQWDIIVNREWRWADNSFTLTSTASYLPNKMSSYQVNSQFLSEQYYDDNWQFLIKGRYSF